MCSTRVAVSKCPSPLRLAPRMACRPTAAQLHHREPAEHGLDLVRIHRGDHPVPWIAAGLGVLPGADRLQFRLRELLRILRDRTAQVRQPGEKVDGEHRGHGMLAPLGAPEILDRTSGRLLGRTLGLPLRGQWPGIAQPTASVPPQGVTNWAGVRIRIATL